MRVLYHPEFAEDVRRFAGHYGEISLKLKQRFQNEIDMVLAQIKERPTSAGHILNTGSAIAADIRRKNLDSFPYFVLYGLHGDLLVFGSIIPTASDPLMWLKRFGKDA
ncbi:hypothetical protein [Chthoniobacter flavus]|nr:hypothetical protein [Chthoniobacter flavus]